VSDLSDFSDLSEPERYLKCSDNVVWCIARAAGLAIARCTLASEWYVRVGSVGQVIRCYEDIAHVQKIPGITCADISARIRPFFRNTSGYSPDTALQKVCLAMGSSRAATHLGSPSQKRPRRASAQQKKNAPAGSSAPAPQGMAHATSGGELIGAIEERTV